MKNSTRTLSLVFYFLICSAAVIARDRQNIIPSPQASAVTPAQTNFLNAITPFYSEDFASGLPASWQAIDTAGNGANWKYTTTGAKNGDSLSVTTSTAANGYMIYDSDSALVGTDSAELVTGPIDCSTHPNVHLNFNEYIVHFNEIAAVYVSNDGTNWTLVHDASAGLTTHMGSPNARNVDVDITAIAANEDSVWVRFSYHANYSYYWMIDDVVLHEVAAYDGALAGITAPGSSCTMLTNSEAVSIEISNTGGADIDTCIVTYVVDGGTPESDTVVANIAVGAVFPYTFTTNADFSAAGAHNIQAYVMVSGDTNAVNDTAYVQLWNGSHIVDAVTSYSNGFESSDPYSTFDIEDANQDSITWALDTQFPHTGTTAAIILAPGSPATTDDWLYTSCMTLDTGVTYALSYWGRRLTTSQQANLQIAIGTDQSAGSMSQLILTNTPVVNVVYTQSYHSFTVPAAGTYYIGFEVSNADSAVGFVIDDINVGIDNGAGVKENLNDKISVYPNPTSGSIFITCNVKVSDAYQIEVTNSIGEVVKSVKANELNDYRLDMNGFTSGMYIVRVISQSGVSTHRINVSK